MASTLRWLIAAGLSVAFATLGYAEDGVTDSLLLNGQTVGMTGTGAARVKEVNEGANAIFSLVNRQRGVHERAIQLMTLDDKFDPPLTLINAETLIKEERAFALFMSAAPRSVRNSVW